MGNPNRDHPSPSGPGAYEASEPARHFFSLLNLRARSSTLVFSAPGRITIASLPIEIVEHVLTYLHLNLLRKARRALVRKVGGKCGCELYHHYCGIDCSSMALCCEEEWSDPDYPRMDRFQHELFQFYRPKIHRLLSIFHLEFIVAPAVSECDGTLGNTTDTVVGIPFVSSPPLPPLPPRARYWHALPSPLSHVQPESDTENSDLAQTTSLEVPRALTTKERVRFKRFVRVLHLVQDAPSRRIRKEGGPTKVEDSASGSKSVEAGLGRDGSYTLGNGTTMLEPKMMLVHASWCSF